MYLGGRSPGEVLMLTSSSLQAMVQAGPEASWNVNDAESMFSFKASSGLAKPIPRAKPNAGHQGGEDGADLFAPSFTREVYDMAAVCAHWPHASASALSKRKKRNLNVCSKQTPSQ